MAPRNQVAASLLRLHGTGSELLRLEHALSIEGHPELAEEVDHLAGRYNSLLERVRTASAPARRGDGGK